MVQRSDPVAARFLAWAERKKARIQAVMEVWAREVEEQMRIDAPWTDRTGNARNSLETFTDFSTEIYQVILNGGMEYVIWLELANDGKYKIIWPTLERNLPKLREYLQKAMDE